MVVSAVEPVEETSRLPERPAATMQASEGWPTPVSRTEYSNLGLDWSRHVGRVERAGVSLYDLDGVAEFVRRIAAFAAKERAPAEPRHRLQAMLERYWAHVRAGSRVRDWHQASDRHWQSFDDLARRARALDLRPEDLPSWPDWLEGNERLVREGRAILDDTGTYGVHLDRMEGARRPLRDTVTPMERFSSAYRSLRSRDRRPSWSM